MNDDDKNVVDAVVYVTTFAALLKWLPPIVMILTAVWTIIRIYETVTVQKIVGTLSQWWHR